jgi:hypothetical protein
MINPVPKHLILVCCHAIYLGGPSNGLHEEEWLMASFQSGETATFTQHAQAGLNLLSNDPSGLLIFSGSKTRKEVKSSEAQSYLDLCLHNNFWGLLDNCKQKEEIVRERIALEEQALDSSGNLIFSAMLFWKRTGQWPAKITIVSHEFKRERFLDLHVGAMRWPRAKVEYLGIDPVYMTEASREWDGERTQAVRKGEKERGLGVWEKDRFGTGQFLRGKRRERNHWQVGQMLFGSEGERLRSQVRSEIMEYEDGLREEVLKDERQPWEMDL